MNKLIAFSAMIVIFAACGSKGALTGQQAVVDPSAPSAQKDLSTLSTSEALSTKYDSAALSCSLWTHEGTFALSSQSPDDSVSIDLLKDSSFPKSVELNARTSTHTVSLKIVFDGLELVNRAYEGSNSATYTLKTSPEIQGEYSGKSRTKYAKGYTEQSFEGNTLTIGENLNALVTAGASGPTWQTPIVDYAECTIATVAKAAYKDQWNQGSSGNAPACIIADATDLSKCILTRN